MPANALVIDAANVIGSRPDGWWRDRPGAAAKLVARVVRAITEGALVDPVVVVLEGAARAGAPADSPVAGLRVIHADRDGDSAIVAQVAALSANGVAATVVTADRGLRDRIASAGGQVVGPSWLLDRLP
jgi:hypothetical protein